MYTVNQTTRGASALPEHPPTYLSSINNSDYSGSDISTSNAAARSRLYPSLVTSGSTTLPSAATSEISHGGPAAGSGGESGRIDPSNFAVLLEGNSSASILLPEQKSIPQ